MATSCSGVSELWRGKHKVQGSYKSVDFFVGAPASRSGNLSTLTMDATRLQEDKQSLLFLNDFHRRDQGLVVCDANARPVVVLPGRGLMSPVAGVGPNAGHPC